MATLELIALWFILGIVVSVILGALIHRVENRNELPTPGVTEIAPTQPDAEGEISLLLMTSRCLSLYGGCRV